MAWLSASRNRNAHGRGRWVGVSTCGLSVVYFFATFSQAIKPMIMYQVTSSPIPIDQSAAPEMSN